MEKEAYFHEAFAQMDRLGPGSVESTQKAIRFYPEPQRHIRILDIGCGIGTHTWLLAKWFPNAEIVAIDLHAPHIAALNQTAEQRGLSHRVRGIQMSMFELAFEEESFDLIWAEGAIYIIGFQRGLAEWRRILKPEGYLICDELCWLTAAPDEESRCFWQEAYAEIALIDTKLEQVNAAGYEVQSHFVCPVTDWTVNYYDPMQKNLDTMRGKYAKNEAALAVVNALQEEVDLYRHHGSDYSYVFFVNKKKHFGGNDNVD